MSDRDKEPSEATPADLTPPQREVYNNLMRKPGSSHRECMNAALASEPADLEETYTLAEARKIVRREICLSEGGHDLEQIVTSTYARTAGSITVHCARCRVQFKEVGE